MNFKTIFTTSVGQKLVMAITGLSLIGFLVVHCYVNALIFLDDSGGKFVEAASFMSHNPIIRILEVGLILGFLVHIIQGLRLVFANAGKRKVKYKVKPGNATSKWYSRYMGILGTLLLLFLIIHMGHFWWPNRTGQFAEEADMFVKMKTVFQSPAIVAVYVVGCLSLAFHLTQGFYAAFQSMGWTSARYASLIRGVGIGFAIIVPLIFAAMPIWMHIHFA